MHIKKSFIKSSIIYTLGGALPLASAIILLPFYIAYLSAADFGALSVYFAFALFIQILTTYSFDTSLYIHFHEYKNDKTKLASFISSAFVLMLYIGAGVGSVFILSGDFIFGAIFTEAPIAFYPYGLLTAGTGIFQALFKTHGNLLQAREKPVIFFWSNVFSFFLIVVFTIAGLKLFPGTLVGPVGGRLLAAAVSGFWALGRIFREFGFHFDFPLVRSSFRFNLFTFIYQLLQWVINYFDRIIMVFFLPLTAIGIYDFATKCMLIMEFVLNGLHNSFYPKIVSTIIAQPVKGSSPEINRYYHGLIAVIMVLMCFCVLVFPWLIETFVNKPGYEASVEYIPYIGALYIFRSIRLFYAVPYNILKHTQPLPAIYLAVSILKIGLTVFLIRWLGIYGVIISSLVSAIAELWLLRYNLKDKFLFHYNGSKILIAPILLFMIIVILEPLFGDKIPALLHFFYAIFCMVLLGWVYRQDVKLINPFKLIR